MKSLKVIHRVRFANASQINMVTAQMKVLFNSSFGKGHWRLEKAIDSLLVTLVANKKAHRGRMKNFLMGAAFMSGAFCTPSGDPIDPKSSLLLKTVEALEFIVNDAPSAGEDAVLTTRGYDMACAALADVKKLFPLPPFDPNQPLPLSEQHNPPGNCNCVTKGCGHKASYRSDGTTAGYCLDCIKKHKNAKKCKKENKPKKR